MRTLVVVVVVVVGVLGGALAAPAADGNPPCMKDVARWCSEMPDIDGYLGTCLQGHWNDISPECRKTLNKDPDREIEVRAACESDKNRLCGDVLRGGAYNLECLVAHKDELSTKCRAILEHKPSGGGTDTPKDPGVEIITPKGSDLAPIERQPNDASE